MTDSDIAKAFQLFHDLRQPATTNLAQDVGEAVGLVIRSGNQFSFQENRRYQLARTVLLLRDVWARTELASAVKPLDDLTRLTGLDLDRILFFGWAFTGASGDGFVRKYAPDAKAKLFSVDAQEHFFNWVSTDYWTIRNRAEDARINVPDDSFDVFRFNPLVLFPIVRPDKQPDPGNGPLFLVPCARLLFERVHRGLYHLLADAHRGEGVENAFRSAFGHVFQEYVGDLLRAALGASNVFFERKYPDGKSPSWISVDWIVRNGNRAVLIEVKQSALSLPAKSLGDLAQARADLRKTIAKAMTQLARTENAIRANTSGLEDLADVVEFERLIVSYDPIYWANSFTRDLANEAEWRKSKGTFTFARLTNSNMFFRSAMTKPWPIF